MGIHSIRMPDIGEGIAEAELVEWAVAPGAVVREDDVLAAVMTDKATVEIPSPVAGKVIWLGGEIGQKLAVGAELIRLEVEGAGNIAAGAAAEPAPPPAAPEPVAEAEAAPVPNRSRNRNPPPLCGARGKSRSPRPRSGGGRAKPGWICACCAVPARPGASAMTIWTPISRRAPPPGLHVPRAIPRSRRSR